MHGPRERRHGDPTAGRRPDGQDFWEKVNKTSSCWEWTAGRSAAGYGETRRPDGSAVYAHRYVIELLGEPRVPAHLIVHHDCRNKACVRRSHLMIVTRKEHAEIHRLDWALGLVGL